MIAADADKDFSASRQCHLKIMFTLPSGQTTKNASPGVHGLERAMWRVALKSFSVDAIAVACPLCCQSKSPTEPNLFEVASSVPDRRSGAMSLSSRNRCFQLVHGIMHKSAIPSHLRKGPHAPRISAPTALLSWERSTKRPESLQSH